MATKAFIQNLINTNLADDSDILPSEHRAVEDTLLNEQFPSTIVVEWDGEAPVSPTTDIVCGGSLSAADNVYFKVYFWKQGNTVYINGFVKNLSLVSVMSDLSLIDFDTSLYRPLTTSSIKMNIIGRTLNLETKQIVYANNLGVFITSALPSYTIFPDEWLFHGSYKVAN